MTRPSRKLVIAWMIVAILILLFPHYSLRGAATVDHGWGFLFTGALKSDGYAHMATPDVGLLLVMELVAAAVFAAAHLLTRTNGDPR